MGVRAVPQPVRLDRKEDLEIGWSVGGLRLARNMDKNLLDGAFNATIIGSSER